jgi:hypothetical protein
LAINKALHPSIGIPRAACWFATIVPRFRTCLGILLAGSFAAEVFAQQETPIPGDLQLAWAWVNEPVPDRTYWTSNTPTLFAKEEDTRGVKLQAKGGSLPLFEGSGQLRVAPPHISEIVLWIRRVSERSNDISDDKPPFIVVNGAEDFFPLEQGDPPFRVGFRSVHGLGQNMRCAERAGNLQNESGQNSPE